jgi:hypothetical protein
MGSDYLTRAREAAKKAVGTLSSTWDATRNYFSPKPLYHGVVQKSEEHLALLARTEEEISARNRLSEQLADTDCFHRNSFERV